MALAISHVVVLTILGSMIDLNTTVNGGEK